MEIVPGKALVVRREKTIVAASWFGGGALRPYIHPFLGPRDLELTRLGHPADPVSHSHHRSIWIGHRDVSGLNFWEEVAGAGRIEQTSATVRTARGEEVRAELQCEWRADDGRRILLEKRGLSFHDLGGGELALEIEIELAPAGKDPVTLGDTPFGLLGIRVARTISVAERLGGQVLNSQEAEDEAGCLAQHADWCDYSGPIPLPGPRKEAGGAEALPAAMVGIACFNHPANSPSEPLWQVRDDGWMGPSISRGEARSIPAGGSLRARYRIEAHAGRPGEAGIAERYRRWRKQ
jgi:hypothetical protein